MNSNGYPGEYLEFDEDSAAGTAVCEMGRRKNAAAPAFDSATAAGGGALFFHLAQSMESKRVVLIDANRDLVLTYWTVQKRLDDLMACLQSLGESYLAEGGAGRERMYYEVQEEFNAQPFAGTVEVADDQGMRRAALFLFLNRTCYKGLYRQKRRGRFNVPHGSYKAPVICPERAIRAASDVLQGAEIRCGDFETAAGYATERSFVYFAPPYRPLSGTARFTSYEKESFNDHDQIRLAGFYSKLHQRGAKLMLSNSDPKVTDADDNFFDRLYGKFFIHRVPARRSINCNGQRRGEISELIITNYAVNGDN